MEHWFDSATKLLAGGHVSRRGMLRSFLAGGLGALLPGMLRAQQALGPAAAACQSEVEGGRRTYHVSAELSQGGHRFVQRSAWSTEGSNSPGHFTQRVEQDGALLYALRFDSALAYERAERAARLDRDEGGGRSGADGDADRDDRKGHAAAPGRARKAAMLGRLDIEYGDSVRGPRHVVLKLGRESAHGKADGRAIRTAAEARLLEGFSAPVREALQELARQSGGNAGKCRLPALRAEAGNACSDCSNGCDQRAIVCSAIAFAENNPLKLLQCENDWYNCHNNCNRAGGPCCHLECNGGQYCCASGQYCCGGLDGTPPTCCDDGSVCVKGIAESFYPYSYCCPHGSDPAGCQEPDGGQFALYCRRPDQTCCGPYGPCHAGQYCADPAFGICCPNGQPICNLSCCRGTCISYNVGTTAQFEVCCPAPNVACGQVSPDGGPTCCPPGHCRTSPSGRQVCCPHPLCGEVCCDSPAHCQGGQCGIGQKCGDSFCGLVNPQCCNGVCCEDGKCCRGVCCSSTQHCVNGTCMDIQCRPGTAACPDAQGLCCSPDTTCCAATRDCCAAGMMCCGSLGCRAPGDCIQ